MTEGTPLPRASSAELASELETLLSEKARLIAQAEAELVDLRDLGVADQERIRRESYRELFFDTTPKELLWQGEKLLENFSSERYSLTPAYKDLAKIDLVEAYGFILPDEGHRMLEDWEPHNAVGIGVKVEALAKFGNLTSIIFIKKARELALTEEVYIWDDLRVQMLLDVANFGRDVKSLELAYQYILSDDASKDSLPWAPLTQAGALGHYPALQLAKQTLIDSSVDADFRHNERWYEAAATVELIEDQVQRGNIPLRVTPPPHEQDRVKSIKEKWDNMLLWERDGIIAALKKPVHIPVDDSFSRALFDRFDTVQRRLSECSVIKTKDELKSHVYTAINRYIRALHDQGPAILDELLADTTDTTAYRMPRSLVKKKMEEFRESHYYKNAASIFTLAGLSQPTVDDSVEAYSTQLQEILPNINLLCLIRAISVTAIQTARQNK